MRALRPAAILLCLFSSSTALAYEGAGRAQEQEAPPPPKQPVLTKPPAVSKGVEAAYPIDLLSQTPPPAGTVKLIIEIGADGHVPKATILESSGFEAMDAAALAAIKLFEFSPAELDGKPAAIRLQYDFHFAPPPPPPPPPPDAPPPPATVNLTGRVLERGTRDPLVSATVYLPGSELHAETDKEGRFEIRGAPAGRVHIEVKEPKHRTFTTDEDIKEKQVTEVTYYLWKQIEGEFEATVHGQRDKKDVSHRTLDQGELRTVPGTFGDPVRVIQNLPGMARPPYGIGALLVRGSQPQDTMTLIDGVPIPILFHFAGGPSVLNPSFIDRVDFFPGAFGAKYGRAIAGIVDVATKAPVPKAIHGDLQIDLLQSNFYLEGPVSKDHPEWGTWEFAARRSYIDLILPSLLGLANRPGQAIISAAPVYWDYQARYDLKVGRHLFEFSAFGSDDQLAVAQAGTAQTTGFSLYTRQGFHRLRARWTTKTEDGWTFSVSPSTGPTINSFNFSDQITGDVNYWDINLRASASKELLPKLTLETGIELENQLFGVTYKAPVFAHYQQFPDESPTTPLAKQSFSANGYAQAAYAEVVWNPIGGLKLVPGFRFELYEFPAGAKPSPEPRLALRYEFESTGTALKAGWGMYRQPPQAQFLDKQYGNPKLGLADATQYVGGVEQKITESLSLDVQGFYNWRYHLVESGNTGSQVNYANTGRGRAYGLEVLLKQNVTSRMYGWIAYTLSRSEQWNKSINDYSVTTFDQTHILTVVASYKFDWGIEAGLRFQFTTGRPFTPTKGATFDADELGYNRVLGNAGSERLPPHHQLDLRVEKLWTFDLWRFSVFLDIQNVYNAENAEATLTNFDYTQSASLRGLPFLPTIGIAGHF